MTDKSKPSRQEHERPTSAEILQAFGENIEEIVPPLLAERRAQRSALDGIVKDELEAIDQESEDDFYRYFWSEIRVVWRLGRHLDYIDAHIARLKEDLRLARGDPDPPGKLTEELIQAAREVSIESFIDQPYHRSGRILRGLCPFHSENSPSFVIYIDQNRAHCFGGCGADGDAIDIYRLLHNCGFKEAVLGLTGGEI